MLMRRGGAAAPRLGCPVRPSRRRFPWARVESCPGSDCLGRAGLGPLRHLLGCCGLALPELPSLATSRLPVLSLPPAGPAPPPSPAGPWLPLFALLGRPLPLPALSRSFLSSSLVGCLFGSAPVSSCIPGAFARPRPLIPAGGVSWRGSLPTGDPGRPELGVPGQLPTL